MILRCFPTAHAADRDRLRAKLLRQMTDAGDLGLLPERERHARALTRIPHDLGADAEGNPIEALWTAADLAASFYSA